MASNIEYIIFIFEIIGTVAFAITGVMAAIEKEVDFFGAIVLGATTAVGGGALRDIMLGITPPTFFYKPVYILTAVIVSAFVFLVMYIYRGGGKHIAFYNNIINIFDAIGLAVFVITGMNTAIRQGYIKNGFLVIFIGTITGIGGGVLRDVLIGKIPAVLRKHIYALAAIIGAVLYYVFLICKINESLSILISAASIIIIRLLAIRYKWNLPKISDRL